MEIGIYRNVQSVRKYILGILELLKDHHSNHKNKKIT